MTVLKKKVPVVVLVEVAGDQPGEAAVKAVTEALHAAADRDQTLHPGISFADGALLTWLPDGQRCVVDVESVTELEGQVLPLFNRKTLDLLERCRSAKRNHGGHPYGGWSTGEQLFVALVLKDRATLDVLGYSVQDAAQRLAGEMWSPHTPEEFMRWLTALRVELAFPGFVTGDQQAVRRG